MTKDFFFARENHLSILEKRIRDLKDGYRQNIAVIGDELVGKTSIIFQFLNKFCDPRIIILYLEARPETTISFARRFIGVLLYNFLINSGQPIKEDLEFLINKSQRYIPLTVEKTKNILGSLEKRKKFNLIAELFGLCEQIKSETGKSCVVIFDEFHNLENLGVKNLYPEWSKSLIQQKNTMFIIISSQKYRARNILAKNLSLLFGNFEIITVEPFDIKTSERYLGIKFLQSQINPGLKNFIIHFTGGYPFYLELISDAYLKNTQENLEQVLESLLFEPCGALNQRFSNYLKRFLDSSDSQDYLSIIHLVSKGHNKIRDLAHLMRQTQKNILLKINNLQEFDVLSRSGDFVAVSDRVFSFWLKFVYQGKIHSLTFDARNQRELFLENIKGSIKEFLTNAQKPVTERIHELLKLFTDDTIQIEKKRFRLTHFREIKSLDFNQRNFNEGLIGRSNEALWIIAFKREVLTEEDIAEFSRECKKYRHKLQRKIIVTNSDIETNARLRALEEKILTWNINNLNQILDLFSRPRIIV
ncbi:MAG: ATP-binding protein [Candidatus Omnitrophica bacterium]|nr:ATP-binding protein [Candidatus Omnitrophota bacterium]